MRVVARGLLFRDIPISSLSAKLVNQDHYFLYCPDLSHYLYPPKIPKCSSVVSWSNQSLSRSISGFQFSDFHPSGLPFHSALCILNSPLPAVRPQVFRWLIFNIGGPASMPLFFVNLVCLCSKCWCSGHPAHPEFICHGSVTACHG